jgi:hypothetical protein
MVENTEPDMRPEPLANLLEESSERLNKSKKTNGHGGRRANQGRPLGAKNKSTIERDAIKKALIDRIHRNADRLVSAQLGKAVGETYLMVQHTIGKGAAQHRETEIVTDPETIKQYLDDELDYDHDKEYYYMTTKPADNSALQGLLDRAFGKAPTSLDLTSGGDKLGVGLSAEQAEQLIAARASRSDI